MCDRPRSEADDSRPRARGADRRRFAGWPRCRRSTARAGRILLTALLSPRDEAEILSHLRARDGAEHVQTHTIPQLASSSEDGEAAPQGGLLSKLRRKKVAEPIPGCDPAAFADEVSSFIARAAEMKVITSTPSAQAASAAAKQGHAAASVNDHQAEPEVEASSAWSSPFE